MTRTPLRLGAVAAVLAAGLALIIVIGVIAVSAGLTPLRAQGRPRVSPHESVEQTVDGARIAIVYGRPSMRGRKIFGSLVPYGRVWNPGADEATTLESSKDILLGGLRVPAGPHTIWILPTAERWTFIVSKDPSGFHTRYFPNRDIGRVDFARRELDSPVEQLTFEIQPAASGGEVAMLWERTRVSVPFTVVR